MAASTVEVELPKPDDVLIAREAIRGRLVRTPVLRSDALDELTGSQVFLKAETLQVTGSFKVRGLCNKVLSLSQAEIERGLVIASAGNAALGAAYAARLRGASIVVLMPENAVAAKAVAVRALGAQLETDGITSGAHALELLPEVQAERGYTVVHPFDDSLVIAGQGTATLELLEEHPDLDALVVPTSGGGLLGGALLAAQLPNPGRTNGAPIRVFGVQPAGADAIVRSLAAGRIVAEPSVRTIADGLTAPQPGVRNFELIRREVEEVFAVDDEEILRAMTQLLRHLRVLVEPAGATGFAGVLAGRRFAGQRVGVVLSGSNADPALIGRLLVAS